MANPLSISVEEFRANLADFIGRVVYGKERLVVQRYNRDAIVVLSADEYQQLTHKDKPSETKEQGRAELKRMYDGLGKMKGLGSKEIKDGSTTINEVLYGEQGIWRGSGGDGV